jgi:hypothetical protein
MPLDGLKVAEKTPLIRIEEELHVWHVVERVRPLLPSLLRPQARAGPSRSGDTQVVEMELRGADGDARALFELFPRRRRLLPR